MIPKTLHLYWGRNRPLSFMRWLTAASFAHFNPQWTLKVHTPQTPSTAEEWLSREHKGDSGRYQDWFPGLRGIRGLAIEETEPVDPSISEIHRSDLLRWRILHQAGGLWSDFDIFYTAPVHTFGHADVYLCFQRSGERLCRLPSVGFQAARPGTRFFERMVELAQQQYRANEYQSAGSMVLLQLLDRPYRKHLWAIDGETIVLIPPEVVYPVSASGTRVLWGRGSENIRGTSGVHWFAGHPATVPEHMKMTPETLVEHKSGLAVLMREVYAEILAGDALLPEGGAAQEHPGEPAPPLP